MMQVIYVLHTLVINVIEKQIIHKYFIAHTYSKVQSNICPKIINLLYTCTCKYISCKCAAGAGRRVSGALCLIIPCTEQQANYTPCARQTCA
jgi:hypothetical protein